ncbi:hypothetical protein EW142_11585 [Flagellimonas allohymeniacidonis]|uniref:DUF4136 domain-containing protein n=1 Tax=Flagellimonas allohymeniacidonis TaxID=2517819 RepID=A0A4Q8QAI2_9FLAO|nr:hypothetical protein EW142_11585 [Allomuricauda hymeniacidonis]
MINRVLIFLLGSLILSCTSTKLSNSYKSDNFESIQDKNIIVVSRTPQEDIRKSYENEISRKLRSKGFNATASHLVFPNLKPLRNKTVERIAETIAMFKDEGFDILLLTSLRGVEEQEVLRRQEGYGSLLDYYGNKYITLKGYYDDVNAPPKLEPLNKELQPVTQKTVTFILEAVTYNLSLPEEQRLLSVVTTEITNPSTASSVKKGFAKIISEQLAQ